ncbi:hypothetical protein BpHYR1_035236 [Brachionus plicatilis]|uniref:Uncharacterized protein n=1 Tax=Brachionus plicatilis TaxID=10195 RepID=A0A3M7R386_BRAPC|nr:hypothetical protein BpHYR1_035236 [Brachionus plicatilis]
MSKKSRTTGTAEYTRFGSTAVDSHVIQPLFDSPAKINFLILAKLFFKAKSSIVSMALITALVMGKCAKIDGLDVALEYFAKESLLFLFEQRTLISTVSELFCYFFNLQMCSCVKAFSKIYEEKTKLGQDFFSFNEVAEELKNMTPVKKINIDCLSYDEIDTSNFMSLSKDCIIGNLCLNPSIQRHPRFRIKSLKFFYEFLNQETVSEESLAQSTFLIHNSKVDYETDPAFLNDVLESFSSIKISLLAGQYPNVFNELRSLFSKILSNKFIQETVDQLIDKLVKKDAVRRTNFDFDYEHLNLKFVDSEYSGLYGYAGRNLIYINTKPFVKLFTKKKMDIFSSEQKFIAIKMTFICVVVHELAHVVLRFRLNDFNKSSPFIKASEINEDKILSNIDECGLQCEKEFFKEAIDWYSSLRKIIQDVEEGRKFDFDTTKTEFVTFDEKKLLKMAYTHLPIFFAVKK